MSEFDKEKEREKLREKYESEAEDRETTRQMSELLLQGATMTNQHCEECGNPVFRYDGQEFCPHCQGEADQEQGDADRRGDDRSQQADARAQRAQGAEGRQDAAPATGPGDGERPAQGEQRSTRATEDAGRSASPPERARQEAGTDGRSREAVAERRPGRDDRPSADLGDGEVALRRTLVKFARLAEETDDPRRARDHLAAAREAAEALSALRR